MGRPIPGGMCGLCCMYLVIIFGSCIACCRFGNPNRRDPHENERSDTYHYQSQNDQYDADGVRYINE